MGFFRHKVKAGQAIEVKSGGELEFESGALVDISGTASAAIMVGLSAHTTVPYVFDVTATLVQVNAGTTAIVPAVAGKQFLPLDVWMQAIGGAAATATLVRLVEETSNAVVLSHVIADMTENTWVGKTGGTVVITALCTPLVAAKAILIDKTGAGLATCTHVRAVVTGFYV